MAKYRLKSIWCSICGGLALVAAMAVAAPPAAAADLLDVRFGPNGEKTRLVIDLAGSPDYAISGDDTGAGRIIIEFAGLTVAQDRRGAAKGAGHFSSYQFTPLDGGDARAVFDLGKTARIAEAFMLEPKGAIKKHRLVIDVETGSKKAFLDSLPQKYVDLTAVIEKATAEPSAKSAPPMQTTPKLAAPEKSVELLAPKAAPAPSLAPAERQIVVIDPGHGGGDPGATGPNGTMEKKVTLAAALQLKELLEKTGRYDVVLTRNGDKKIIPGKREALARNAGADLFISLHADAIAQSTVRGASVYTLSKKGSERSAKEASAEGNYIVNNVDLGADVEKEVSGLLFQLVQRETNNNSSYFAEALISNLGGVTPLLNKTHRTGDLAVLLAPDVPAVLLEMAFISNVDDEANLNSPKWRIKTMRAVASAIDDYFEERELARHASNRAGGAR